MNKWNLIVKCYPDQFNQLGFLNISSAEYVERYYILSWILFKLK